MSATVSVFDEAHAVTCDLAAEALRSSGRLRLRVMGSSMLPSVWPGDTLVIERIEANGVCEGDLVLFGRDRRLFVHRVLSADAGDANILTRGDAMPQPDPLVPWRDLLGRVSYIMRNERLIEPKKNLSLPRRAVAILIQRSEIAMRVIIGVNGMLQALRRQNSNHRVVPCQS
jgi:signal peptidase I